MITLLDGSKHSKASLVEKMYDDSFYYGYLGKNALSSSACKMLLDSPKKYRNITKYGDSSDSKALREGRLFHTMALEPHKLGGMVFIDCKTTATKAFKEAVEENGSENVYTEHEKKYAERLVDSLLRNEAATRLMNGAKYEVPEIGQLYGLPFRAKADILRHNDIVDLKTTSGINTFRYSADKYGYDLQAYIYTQLFGLDEMVFLVVDKLSCDIGIFEVSDDFLDKGRQKLQQATELYKYFFKDGNDLDQYVLRGVL